MAKLSPPRSSTVAQAQKGLVLRQDTVGNVEVQIDSLKLPIPERSYHAQTASAEWNAKKCTFTFAQYRYRSLQHLKSAVDIEMSLHAVRRLLTTFTPEFREAVKRSLSSCGPMPPFPEHPGEGEVNYVFYRAQICRIIVSPEAQAVIDFFGAPIDFPYISKEIDVPDLVRIWCDPSIADAFVGWCDQAAAQEDRK